MDTEMAENPVSATYLQDTLIAKLPASHAEVADISGGCGSAFEAVIVSDAFKGKTTLARHRLVNALLKDELTVIHAWTMKCQTPEEYDKSKATA